MCLHSPEPPWNDNPPRPSMLFGSSRCENDDRITQGSELSTSGPHDPGLTQSSHPFQMCVQHCWLLRKGCHARGTAWPSSHGTHQCPRYMSHDVHRFWWTTPDTLIRLFVCPVAAKTCILRSIMSPNLSTSFYSSNFIRILLFNSVADILENNKTCSDNSSVVTNIPQSVCTTCHK